MPPSTQVEPWLRGTHAAVPPFVRAVLHALELAAEELNLWCSALTVRQLNLSLAGNASVAFHLRHIAGSLDRLLTYAEGRELNDAQLRAKAEELEPGTSTRDLLADLHTALDESRRRVLALANLAPETPRAVGRQALPTTIAGLLVHVADHTQRHVGQAITTAKFVRAERAG